MIPVDCLKQTRFDKHLVVARWNACGENTVNETNKPILNTEAEPETDREMTEQEITEVAGGFNPQPDPPGRS
jgi:hypothetical protein